MFRFRVRRFLKKISAATAEQVAYRFKKPLDEVKRVLEEMEARGEVKSVKIYGITFYFVDPEAAREVILGSISPDGEN